MKSSMDLPGCIWFVLVLAPVSWSHGFSTDCPKMAESLCADVRTKSDSDTVWVNIILRASITRNQDSCLYSNPDKNPGNVCVDQMDSAFWAKLKLETQEAYAKYSPMMMNGGNPPQRLSYPGDSVGLFIGVNVTKSNLYAIVQDTLILGAESFFFQYPLKSVNPRIASHAGNRNEQWLNFSVNGQRILSADRAKIFQSESPTVRRPTGPLPSRRLPLESPLPRP